MSTAIVKARMNPRPDFNALVLAYWLMYCRTPQDPKPDVDGMFDIGEVGHAAEKNWTKATPYSPAEVRRCGRASETGILRA